jgi:hypothetical protein
VWAHFVFAAQPTRSPIEVRWYRPGGQAGPSLGKPNTPVVESYASVSTGLPPGRWRCILFAGGVPVKTITVRIG